MNQPSTYEHTQRAPLCLMMYAFAILLFFFAWGAAKDEPPFVVLMLVAAGLVMMVLAGSFHHLRVADEVEGIAIRYGPIPLFSKMIRYDEIREVDVGRTTLFEGWGIHKSMRGGWVWNLWGFECVVIAHRGITRVGSDDAENLAAFLKQRINSQSVDRGSKV